MTFTGTEIRRPKDWQTFERGMRVLLSRELGDPDAQRNGRSGQRQNGVDISGQRASNGKLVGMQCKAHLESSVTESELRREVKQALAFQPALNEFILATTAAKDAAIEAVARQITAERRQSAHPMKVVVWGWDDIEDRVAGHRDAVNAFDPTWNPFAEQAWKDTKRYFRRLDQRLDELTQPPAAPRAHPRDVKLLRAFRRLVTTESLDFLARSNFRFYVLLSAMEPFNEIAEKWLGTRYEFVDPELQAAFEPVMGALHRFVGLVDDRIFSADENPRYGSSVTAWDKAAGRARERRAGARIINDIAHELWRAIDKFERAANAMRL